MKTLVLVLPIILIFLPSTVLGQSFDPELFNLPPNQRAAIQMAREASEQIDEMRKDLITDIIELYQIENNSPNPTKLTNEQITEKIWEWYTAPLYDWQHKPEITQDILIKKYLEIVEENPEPIPEPTIDERLDRIFNN